MSIAPSLSRLLLLLSVSAVPALTVFAADRRPRLDLLSIATFNARFLFDGRFPEGSAGFPWKGDPVAARVHLREIASILRRVDADIVHITEVENLETLERLRLEIGDERYRAYLVPGRDTVTRQNVGLLARLDPVEPLARVEGTAEVAGTDSRQGVSKSIVATFQVGDLALTLMGLHLLAFPEDSERNPRREAQAELVRQTAFNAATAMGRLLVILGDFNDFDPDVPDVRGNTSATRVLPTIRAVAPWTQEDDLENAASRLARHQRYTAYHDRNGNAVDDGPDERSLTDHILLSQALSETVREVRVFGEHSPFGPSDHFPMKATLDLSGLQLFRRGDVDGDRRVTERDAILLLRFLFEGAGLDCRAAADSDDSGRVELVDALRLLNRLFLNAPPLPPPGPLLPGSDPTQDELECAGARPTHFYNGFLASDSIRSALVL